MRGHWRQRHEYVEPHCIRTRTRSVPHPHTTSAGLSPPRLARAAPVIQPSPAQPSQPAPLDVAAPLDRPPRPQ